ncbi:VOC family protein [[Leptolyngbya] sp. PCC 7376]|uniref:VOC family protein n=1 Tax=[Leptolyngbya] sp. PCC 7376 TaxID=111781 RepID=UPI00135A2DBC|nr:VOC family protein [[Leptolyngbya] sp. PCC 7376]
MNLSYVVLYVSDLQQSFKFYRDLGFGLTAEQHGNGPPHYSFSVGDLLIELYPAKDKKVSQFRLGIALGNSSPLLQLLDINNEKIVRDPDGNVLHFTKILN